MVLMNCEDTDFIETLKVIFKVRFGNFHISPYRLVVLECWPNIAFYFDMNLPRNGTKPLANVALIELLKVIFQDRKGLKLSLFSNVDTYCLFIPICAVFFPYFGNNSFPKMVLMKCEETDVINLL